MCSRFPGAAPAVPAQPQSPSSPSTETATCWKDSPEPTGPKCPCRRRFAELSIGSRIEHVQLEEVAPPDAIAVLRQWPLRAATGARIMRDAGVIDDVTPDAFATLAGKCTLFQVHNLSTIRHRDSNEST